MTLNSLMMKATLSAKAFAKLFFAACYLLLLFLFVGLSPVAAQPVNNLLGDVAMPSPEAASLGKYTDIPVGYYTGTPSISVPVHSAKDGTVSLPVSLSYHASGVKVGEPASWVGLGWSLNAGGRVIRTVIGKPDEHFGGYFLSGLTVQNIPDMDPNNPLIPGTPAYQALDDIFQGNIDGEADIFSFNFAGYSGKFYFDKNGEPVLVPKQNLLIQRHDKSTSNESDRIKGFTIIAPDGVKYHFGVNSASSQATPMVEKTAAMGENPVASSWMLVKVESVDGQHEINLSYDAEQYSYNSLGSCSSVELNSGSGCSRVNWYDVTTYRLSLISYNLGSIEFIADESAREDLHPYQYFYNGGPYNYGPL
ncbi:MAG: hypothetical protein KDD02_21645 [Phaeodactylibacter sp.]|nr:hypothetical protein [Phaeodactylibacter sp.]MCB9303146.1 hypothetical protein [Lewinellaceae bacterium]